MAEVDAGWVGLVGAKAAALGELIKAAERVPEGFCITTAAHDAVRAPSGGPSDDLRRQIVASYERLGAGAVAVRSSATAEDLPPASFADQYDTVLNVSGADALVGGVRRCWASLASPRALAYRESAGTADGPVRMGVLVQRMVEPLAAGVLFTANPITGTRTEMLSTPQPVSGTRSSTACRCRSLRVDGTTTGHPGRWMPEPGTARAAAPCGVTVAAARGCAAGRRVGVRPDGRALVAAVTAHHDAVPAARVEPAGPTGLPRSRPHAGHAAPVHPDGDVRDAGRHGAVAGVRGSGGRPVRGASRARRRRGGLLLSDGTIPEALMPRGPVTDGTLVGMAAAPGTATGRARVTRDPASAHVEPGEILVAPTTDPGWTPLFLTAGGLVTETGSPMAHGPTVAREYGIPAVICVRDATQLITTGQLVTVDGAAGTVVLAEPQDT